MFIDWALPQQMVQVSAMMSALPALRAVQKSTLRHLMGRPHGPCVNGSHERSLLWRHVRRITQGAVPINGASA
eukprot:6790132-Alexandrium_andersonii.AAC.1